jgi:hypothetical protein
MPDKSEKSQKIAAEIDAALEKFLRQARMQFGDAVKSYWFYDGKLCPACSRRPIEVFKFKAKDALSMNAFIHRERGVLIGYFLCERCAKQVFRDARINPYVQTPVHAEIERNLIAGYQAFERGFNN